MLNIFNVSEVMLPFDDMQDKENPTAGQNPDSPSWQCGGSDQNRFRKWIPHIALHL